MKRDDLIEELKKCPYNNEVRVRLTVHPDYFDRIPQGECPVEELQIDGVIAIPQIIIDCEQART